MRMSRGGVVTKRAKVEATARALFAVFDEVFAEWEMISTDAQDRWRIKANEVLEQLDLKEEGQEMKSPPAKAKHDDETTSAAYKAVCESQNRLVRRLDILEGRLVSLEQAVDRDDRDESETSEVLESLDVQRLLEWLEIIGHSDIDVDPKGETGPDSPYNALVHAAGAARIALGEWTDAGGKARAGSDEAIRRDYREEGLRLMEETEPDAATRMMAALEAALGYPVRGPNYSYHDEDTDEPRWSWPGLVVGKTGDDYDLIIESGNPSAYYHLGWIAHEAIREALRPLLAAGPAPLDPTRVERVTIGEAIRRAHEHTASVDAGLLREAERDVAEADYSEEKAPSNPGPEPRVVWSEVMTALDKACMMAPGKFTQPILRMNLGLEPFETGKRYRVTVTEEETE